MPHLCRTVWWSSWLVGKTSSSQVPCRHLLDVSCYVIADQGSKVGPNTCQQPQRSLSPCHAQGMLGRGSPFCSTVSLRISGKYTRRTLETASRSLLPLASPPHTSAVGLVPLQILHVLHSCSSSSSRSAACCAGGPVARVAVRSCFDSMLSPSMLTPCGVNCTGTTLHSATGIGVPQTLADFGRVLSQRNLPRFRKLKVRLSDEPGL